VLSIIGSLQLHRNPHLIIAILLPDIVVCPKVQNLDGKIIFLFILGCGKPSVEDKFK